jgi:hypothetical protein
MFFTATISVSLLLTEPQNTVTAVAATQRQLDTVSAAIARYKADTGAAPPNLNALVTRTGANCAPDLDPSSPTFRALRGWCGPYLEQAIGDLFQRDGWGQVLQFDGTVLKSCGPNRTCGDGDDIAVTP